MKRQEIVLKFIWIKFSDISEIYRENCKKLIENAINNVFNAYQTIAQTTMYLLQLRDLVLENFHQHSCWFEFGRVLAQLENPSKGYSAERISIDLRNVLNHRHFDS